MKITVVPTEIEIGRFSLQMRDPGTVRCVAFSLKKSLVMTAGRPEFEEQPVMFVEAALNAPLRNRSFVAFTHGEAFECDEDERAVWCGTGISGANGRVIHLFELIKRPEAAS